jgi:hypothetical protein
MQSDFIFFLTFIHSFIHFFFLFFLPSFFFFFFVSAYLTHSIGLGYEAQGVQAAFLAGKLESDEISLEESLRIMTAMDTIRMQIGVTYRNEQRAFQGFSQ